MALEIIKMWDHLINCKACNLSSRRQEQSKANVSSVATEGILLAQMNGDLRGGEIRVKIYSHCVPF